MLLFLPFISLVNLILYSACLISVHKHYLTSGYGLLFSLSLSLSVRHTCFTGDTCILNISCKIVQEGYLVYECNSMCSCNKTCPNRVLQNGIRVKLEVFKTDNKVTNLPN